MLSPTLNSLTRGSIFFSYNKKSKVVVHTYNRILLSQKKNKFESVEVRWMNPESCVEPRVIQGEVSQKEKNKYCILTHLYGIYENGSDDPICRTGDVEVDNGLADTGRRGGQMN